jgi:hypothetical protein
MQSGIMKNIVYDWQTSVSVKLDAIFKLFTDLCKNGGVDQCLNPR